MHFPFLVILVVNCCSFELKFDARKIYEMEEIVLVN